MFPTQITNYIEQGLAFFTSEYQNGNAPQLQALVASWLGECQTLENVLWDVINLRQLANLRVYSPLVGTFSVINGNAQVPASQSQTNLIIPGLSILTFSNYATTYSVTAISTNG